jgi:ArsR family transcriptional regulator, arsenate/arsenite/antimonite-responsive transcriptional repressor
MRDKIELFKVMSEPNRVRILMMLLQKPLCVCEITSILELTTATVSNHLSYLRQNGFIEDEKEGKWINYRIVKNIEDPMVKNLIDSLPDWFAREKEIQEDLLKVKNVDRYEIICSDKDDKKRN